MDLKRCVSTFCVIMVTVLGNSTANIDESSGKDHYSSQDNSTELYQISSKYSTTVGYQTSSQDNSTGQYQTSSQDNSTELYQISSKYSTTGGYQTSSQDNSTGGYQTSSEYNYEHDYSYYYYDYEEYVHDYSDLNGQDCVDVQTCHNNQSKSSWRSCKCDVICGVYKDCCVDVRHEGADVKILPKQKELSPYIGCEYIPEIYEFHFIFIVNSCPTESDEILRSLCTNVENDNIVSTTPAVGKESGFLYKNMYCAMCHTEEFSLWLPQIFCRWRTPYSGNYTVEELMKLDECHFSYVANNSDISVRECYPAVSVCSVEDNTNISTQPSTRTNISTQPSTSTNLGTSPGTELGINSSTRDLCESSGSISAYVFTTDVIYKNIHCFLCNNDPAENVSCSFRIFNFNYTVVNRNGGFYSYRLLFDLNTDSAKSIKGERRYAEEEELSLRSHCEGSQVYDPFAKKCRDVFCTPGDVFSNGLCTRRTDNTSSTVDNSCTVIRFNESEFDLINETSIRLHADNITYDGVIIRDNVAYMCIHAPMSRKLTPSDYAEEILSLLCSSVSIFCLFLTIVIYSFPKLRNMAGKILLCLSTSLLVAQLLFLLAPLAEQFPGSCEAVAILDHYFYLASFFWMSVMSFDVFNTFSKSFRSAKDNTKRFVFYTLYAWLLPLVLVTAGILADELTISTYRPEYGEAVCWISSSNGLLIFFLAPIAILLIVNVIFYSVSTYNICTTSRKSAKNLNRKNQCEILIYLKLSTVMGLTWIFGYVATLVNNSVLWYLFIIFNGVQGLFIFCSFVLNKKVSVLICRCVRNKDVSRTTTTSKTVKSMTSVM